MATVKFSRGKQIAIDTINSNKTGVDGQFYLATDTSHLYVANADGTLSLLKDDIDTKYAMADINGAGLMSAAQYNKLAGITDSADSVSFTRSLTSGTKVGTITVNGIGTDIYAPTDTNTWTAFKGATSSAAGTAGYVPAPSSGQTGLFFKSDGTWATPANTTYSANKGITLTDTTFGHTNSVTASTAGSSTPSSGAIVAVPYVSYDAYGHVTGSGTHTHTIISLSSDALSDGAVTTTKINNGAVTTAKIADTNVTTAKIADNAVTDAKISGISASKITGIISAANLPSYVDDVVEGYYHGTTTNGNTTYAFYSSRNGDAGSYTYTNQITGESGKIYVNLEDNKTYRWSGSNYVVISETIALGTTSSTAGRGDWTKAAYDHISNTSNPHGVTKSQVGLSNVANIDQSKAINSITRSGTTFTYTTLDGTTGTFTQQDNNTDTTYTMSISDHTITLKPSSGDVQTITVPDNNNTYAAGSGLSMATDNKTINHASTITSGTVGTSSATSGATLTVPYVTYNETGHITAVGTNTHTINGLSTSAISNGTFDIARIPTITVDKGGTGSTTADGARSNLSVYSKTETDNAISTALTWTEL